MSLVELLLTAAILLVISSGMVGSVLALPLLLKKHDL